MHVAVLGTGNMGKAIIAGILKKPRAGTIISAHDVHAPALSGLPSAVRVVPPAEWFVADVPPEVIVVAVKPADVDAALKPLADAGVAGQDVLWLSIAAGISIASLERALGPRVRICRAMPNTPALIGEGMAAFALNGECSRADVDKVDFVLGSCGKVVEIKEKMMNAVTGLSGSGPAYVYLFIEALIEGGVAAGLSYATARECAVQTVVGAARMVQTTGEQPSQLKAKVMSPGGTTARGLMSLEQHQFKFAVMQAVCRAAERAEELGG